MTNPTAITPFRIEVPQAALDDLRARLENTRWPDELPGTEAAYGIPYGPLKELAEHWRSAYNWRAHETRLNELPHFTTTIDGEQIHFVHVRSPEPDALALILTHGWPSTFTEFLDMIGPLSDPRAHGGDPSDAFHVVIPSVPGYGFSGPTRSKGWGSRRVAAAWHELMRRLGYGRYGAQGGDLGSFVARELGVLAPEGLLGIHVMQIFAFPSGDRAELAQVREEDTKAMAILGDFQDRSGYMAINSTRPQTIGIGLNESPAALLAWNLELPSAFGEQMEQLDRDRVLTDVTIYWLTGTATRRRGATTRMRTAAATTRLRTRSQQESRSSRTTSSRCGASPSAPTPTSCAGPRCSTAATSPRPTRPTCSPTTCGSSSASCGKGWFLV
jgi:epoxide hydrolase